MRFPSVIVQTTLQQLMVPKNRKTFEILQSKVPGEASTICLETDPEGVHEDYYSNQYFPHGLRFLYPGSEA